MNGYQEHSHALPRWACAQQLEIRRLGLNLLSGGEAHPRRVAYDMMKLSHMSRLAQDPVSFISPKRPGVKGICRPFRQAASLLAGRSCAGRGAEPDAPSSQTLGGITLMTPPPAAPDCTAGRSVRIPLARAMSSGQDAVRTVVTPSSLVVGGAAEGSVHSRAH